MATAGVLLFQEGVGAGPHVKRSELKFTTVGVHTQGVAYTRQFVATAGVFFFQGAAGLAPVSSKASPLSRLPPGGGGAGGAAEAHWGNNGRL